MVDDSPDQVSIVKASSRTLQRAQVGGPKEGQDVQVQLAGEGGDVVGRREREWRFETHSLGFPP